MKRTAFTKSTAGRVIGRLHSSNKGAEILVCVVLMGLFAIAFALGFPIPMLLMCFSIAGVIAIGTCVMMKQMPGFGTPIVVYENGVLLRSDGTMHRFMMNEVESYRLRQAHNAVERNGKMQYFGTLLDIEIKLPWAKDTKRCRVQYNAVEDSHAAIEHLTDQLAEHVMKRVLQTMTEEGSVALSNTVQLNGMGLLIGESQQINFDEIGRWETIDDETAFCKSGSTIPFVTIHRDVENFDAKLRVFELLWKRTQEATAVA